MDEVVKQPREVVDYMPDLRQWFREIPEPDHVVDTTIDIEPSGDPDDLVSGPGALPVWSPVFDPIHAVKCWFGGGRDGVEYTVTATITTDAGRVEVFKWIIRVEEQS